MTEEKCPYTDCDYRNSACDKDENRRGYCPALKGWNDGREQTLDDVIAKATELSRVQGDGLREWDMLNLAHLEREIKAMKGNK